MLERETKLRLWKIIMGLSLLAFVPMTASSCKSAVEAAISRIKQGE